MLASERLAGSWIRWFGVLGAITNDASNKGVTLKQLPRPIPARLVAITEAAEELCAAIERKFVRTLVKSREKPPPKRK